MALTALARRASLPGLTVARVCPVLNQRATYVVGQVRPLWPALGKVGVRDGWGEEGGGRGLDWAEPPAAWRLTQLLLVVFGLCLNMLYSFLWLGPSLCPCCTHTHKHTNLHYYTCEDNVLPYIHSLEAYHNRYIPNPNLNLVLILILTPKPSINPKVNLVETEFLHMWSCEDFYVHNVLNALHAHIHTHYETCSQY